MQSWKLVRNSSLRISQNLIPDNTTDIRDVLRLYPRTLRRLHFRTMCCWQRRKTAKVNPVFSIPWSLKKRAWNTFVQYSHFNCPGQKEKLDLNRFIFWRIFETSTDICVLYLGNGNYEKRFQHQQVWGLRDDDTYWNFFSCASPQNLSRPCCCTFSPLSTTHGCAQTDIVRLSSCPPMMFRL